jgi:RNA polymerase sigma-70 factor, ECF subfamily
VNSTTAEETHLRDLMVQYQAGRIEGFEQLYAALAQPLGQYLGSLTRDAVRASDLLQETFLQIHRSRHTYSPTLPLKPWAFAIARHVYLMEARRLRRLGAHEAPSEDTLPDLPVPAEAEDWASRDQLARALGRIGEDRREALLLHHLFGLSFREIGTLLGIREGAAKLRASRGMAELRTLLASVHQGGARV